MESTRKLIERIRAGDDEARNLLAARFLPALRRWARGRLPAHARAHVETDDLVQISLLRALSRVEEFRAEQKGAFFGYLHRILLNGIRDEIRRAHREMDRETLPEDLPDDRQTILEKTIGAEFLGRYESALASLPEAQQEVVILRVEFGFTFPEIAEALGRSSANAVRMQLMRALVRLAEGMDEAR